MFSCCKENQSNVLFPKPKIDHLFSVHPFNVHPLRTRLPNCGLFLKIHQCLHSRLLWQSKNILHGTRSHLKTHAPIRQVRLVSNSMFAQASFVIVFPLAQCQWSRSNDNTILHLPFFCLFFLAPHLHTFLHSLSNYDIELFFNARVNDVAFHAWEHVCTLGCSGTNLSSWQELMMVKIL